MVNLARQILFRLAISDTFETLVRRVPAAERAAYRAARRYVAGSSAEDAIAEARRIHELGIAASLDFFGEDIKTFEGAEDAASAYVELASSFHRLHGLDVDLSIDLSHIGLDISPAVCQAHLERIAVALPAPSRLQIGAEDCARTERILTVTQSVAAAGHRVMATLQANLRRSPHDGTRLVAAGIPIRLVKGAYVETSHQAYPWGEETDRAYIRLAHQLRSDGADLALATHDFVTLDALIAALGQMPVELLLGVRNEFAADLVRAGHKVRLYVPFGDGWFRYWMRRVAESRGA